MGANVHTADVEYSCNGLAPRSDKPVDNGRTATPAVLVAHEGNGLTDRTRKQRGKLAELGIRGVRPRLLRRRQTAAARSTTGTFQHPDRRSITHSDDRSRGLDVLLANEYADSGRVAAIGYCFRGARCRYETRPRWRRPQSGSIGFHSGWRRPARGRRQHHWQRARVHRRRGSADPTRTAPGVRGGDARRGRSTGV